MFLDTETEPQLSSQASTPSLGFSWSSFFAGVLCTAGTIALFIAPQWLWDILP
jgi:hypothetical protein